YSAVPAGCALCGLYDGAARLYGWIAQPQRLALLKFDDLLEALSKIELEVIPFRPPEMRRAQHIRHFEKRMVAVDDRLLLVDIHRRVAGPALLQRVEQRAGRYQLGARNIDEQGSRLHACEIVEPDDPPRLR